MNLAAMTCDWKNERSDKPRKRRTLSTTIKGYAKKDIANMIREISSGISQSQAARNNNIPRGSVSRFIPDNLRVRRDKKKTMELVNKKLSGELKISRLEIAERTGYKINTIDYFIIEAKSEKRT